MEDKAIKPGKLIELTKVFARYHCHWWDHTGLFDRKTGVRTEAASVDPLNIREVRDISRNIAESPEAKAEVVLYKGGAFYTQESRAEISARRNEALDLG